MESILPNAPPVDLAGQYSTTFTALCWLKTRCLTAKNVHIQHDSRKTADLIRCEPNLAASLQVSGDPTFLKERLFKENTDFADKVTHWDGYTTRSSQVSSGSFRNLRELEIHYTQRTAAWATEAIANNHKLTSLHITFTTAPDKDFFTALAARGATLTKLTVHFEENEKGDRLLSRFAQCCPQLQELCYDLAFDIYEDWDVIPLQVGQVDAVAKHCRELRELGIYKAAVPETSLRSLMLLCPMLQELRVPDTTVTDHELTILNARCLTDGVDPYPLTHLCVSWAVTDRNTIVNCAGLLRGLQTLGLTCDWRGGQKWEHLPVALAFMSQLSMLLFENAHCYRSNEKTVTYDILSAVAQNCPKLRWLDVTYGGEDNCGDGVTEILSQCGALEALELPHVALSDDVFLGITARSEGAACRPFDSTAS